MVDLRTIRTAGDADLPALLALYQHLIPGDAQPSPKAAREIFARFLAFPGSAIFLAETAGHLVASCTLVVVPNLTRGGACYGLLENVVTHAGHRHQGHGKALLAHATQAAWAAGCYKLMLLTGSSDPATHAFYRSAGFEPSKTGYQIRAIPARGAPPMTPPESWASLPFFTTHWPALAARLATAPAWQPQDPFRALRLTPRDKTRVILLGQDPYPTPGRATGLAFSFPPGQQPRHSLKNILAELSHDTGDTKTDGDLTPWAAQGVLLLNTVLTVPLNDANGHKGWGWERLVCDILTTLAQDGPKAFVLWGAPAQKLCATLPRAGHLFVQSPHPSPLSAHRGFFGSRPFSAINAWLHARGQSPIRWGS